MTIIKPSTPLWMAARVILAERAADLFQRWDRVMKSFGLDDIHDLRVASRRLREALALFAPCFPRKKLRRLNFRVKRLTGILGAMRNTDEALLFFTPLPQQLSEPAAAAVDELVTTLREERERERKSLKQGLKELNPASLRRFFAATCNKPLVFDPAVDSLGSIADYLREKMTERETALLALLPSARVEENVTAQHRLRIAVKRFRYRFELTAPLVGPYFQDILTVIKRYQEILGHMHDLDVFAELFTSRFVLPGETGPVCAIIAGRRHDLFEEFTALLADHPLETIGARIRSLL